MDPGVRRDEPSTREIAEPRKMADDMTALAPPASSASALPISNTA